MTPPPATTTASPAPLVKASVVARHLSCTPRYVGMLAASGKIPSVKIGAHCIRFDLMKVLAALGVAA